MSRNRLMAMGLASVAAIGAAIMARGYLAPQPQAPQKVVKQEEKVDVLVLAHDVKMGQRLSPAVLKWQPWPKSAKIPGLITRDETDSLEDLANYRARVPMIAGEPLLRGKLSQAGQGGVLSSLLPKGMRAIAVKISVETGAGGFIMPGDRVDVILTRRVSSGGGGEEHSVSDVVLQNVRVLAIDQQYLDNAKDAPAVTELRTATLEVTPEQAQVLSRVQSMGELSLALRSLADSEGKGEQAAKPKLSPKFARHAGGDVRIFRFGHTFRMPAAN